MRNIQYFYSVIEWAHFVFLETYKTTRISREIKNAKQNGTFATNCRFGMLRERERVREWLWNGWNLKTIRSIHRNVICCAFSTSTAQLNLHWIFSQFSYQSHQLDKKHVPISASSTTAQHKLRNSDSFGFNSWMDFTFI